jgi:hypothetical protein
MDEVVMTADHARSRRHDRVRQVRPLRQRKFGKSFSTEVGGAGREDGWKGIGGDFYRFLYRSKHQCRLDVLDLARLQRQPVPLLLETGVGDDQHIFARHEAQEREMSRCRRW